MLTAELEWKPAILDNSVRTNGLDCLPSDATVLMVSASIGRVKGYT